jgi:hypothetical protein
MLEPGINAVRTSSSDRHLTDNSESTNKLGVNSDERRECQAPELTPALSAHYALCHRRYA